MESRLHLRNQSAPWVFSWVIRFCDSLHWNSPRAYLFFFHALIGLWSWLGLWTLVRWFRKAHGPAGDRVALRLAWFFALFWAFPMLYSRGLLEALSFTPACLLWMALERRQDWRSGWWAGWSAVLRYPSALWAAGAALLAGTRLATSTKPMPPKRIERAMMGVFLGLGSALVIGGLADYLIYGGKVMSSAVAYWNFNRPHGPVESYFGNDSLVVYWHWFEYLFSPWLAPLFILGAFYALWVTPSLLLFCAPYIAGHLWTPHREPRFMLPLTPFLVLAIAVAIQRGKFGQAAWQRLRESRAAWGTVRALIALHIALNFVWYPLYAWAQLSSGQGVLVRHYRDLEKQGARFALMSDPVAVLGVDALIPPNLPWLDENCRWHRPVQPADANRPLWVLARTQPQSCTLVQDRVPALPHALSRLLRVKTASLYDCGRGEAALQPICPSGVKPALPGEPYFGKELPLATEKLR